MWRHFRKTSERGSPSPALKHRRPRPGGEVSALSTNRALPQERPKSMMSNPLRLLLTSVLLLSQWGGVYADDEPNALQRVQQKGVLEVAVYQGLPPYSFREKGRIVGVDADVARALAAQLGVAASIRAVGADENMEDDLRNNVWKGHYLGGGVADLMLHVPFDPEFAEENDRALFLAPYFREQLVVAIGNVQGGCRADPFELFTEAKVGVELDTLAISICSAHMPGESASRSFISTTTLTRSRP